MRLLLLIAAARAQPEKLLERGTSHYNAGDSTKAQQAFVQLSTDQTAPPHLRAQAYQGLAALAQRRAHLVVDDARVSATPVHASTKARFVSARRGRPPRPGARGQLW